MVYVCITQCSSLQIHDQEIKSYQSAYNGFSERFGTSIKQLANQVIVIIVVVMTSIACLPFTTIHHHYHHHYHHLHFLLLFPLYLTTISILPSTNRVLWKRTTSLLVTTSA